MEKIPDDVMQAARMCTADEEIARAILAERERSKLLVEELRESLRETLGVASRYESGPFIRLSIDAIKAAEET